jgi:hypothetical protein
MYSKQNPPNIEDVSIVEYLTKDFKPKILKILKIEKGCSQSDN